MVRPAHQTLIICSSVARAAYQILIIYCSQVDFGISFQLLLSRILLDSLCLDHSSFLISIHCEKCYPSSLAFVFLPWSCVLVDFFPNANHLHALTTIKEIRIQYFHALTFICDLPTITVHHPKHRSPLIGGSSQGVEKKP